VPLINAIVLEFTPVIRIGDGEVKLETIALAVVVAACLLVAGLIARSTPASGGSHPRLSLDDLLLLAIGALPGVVVGGRVGYVLLHLDYYLEHPAQVVDPAQGGLELTLAVVAGSLTAAYVLRLMEAPMDRWAHVVAFPLLLALGAGKLAMALGGHGQGTPSDLPWASVYVGDGPWGSLAPEIASHPSQVYEGIATLLLLQLMTALVARGVLRGADRYTLYLAVGAWAVIRVLVAFTWRDAAVLGPLGAEQLIALTVAIGAGLLLRRRLQRTFDPAAGTPSAAARQRGPSEPPGAAAVGR
jgi:phosphatidylglycerol:prolipoprotein diacylglycerol transferase